MTSSLGRLISILTLFLVAASAVECAAGARRPRTGGVDPMDGESGERTILRRAYQQLLRLKSLPELRRPGSAKKQRSPPASPPRYMLELYEKYRRSDASVAAKRGNTVRSILSVKGDVNGEQMLLFNLSGISLLGEEILHAELHFYGRRKVKWPERSVISPKYRMKFSSISSEKVQLSPLSSINFTASVLNDGRHGGWRVFDVTRQVTDCRQQSVGLGNHLLAISFQGVNKKLKFVAVPLKTLMKMHNTPFLIVFSNDKDNASQSDDSSDPEENIWNKQNQVPKFLKDDFQFEEQDTKLKSDSAYLEEENSASLKRFSRSVSETNKIDEFDFGGKQQFGSGTMMSWVENNEYPDNSVLPGKEYFPKTNPGVLVPRKRNRTEQANGTIPLPTAMSPFGQKKRLKKKKNATLPSVWQDRSLRGDEKEKGKGKKIMTGLGTADVRVVQSAKGTDESWCQRKRLLVNFDELNWGDWIISPQSFEAYYCSGQCHFPLVKKRNPSNHAIIQSIVNALGIRKEVPAPCCVADAVTSLTLLFFDENHNVVLKNYPGMIVESCACR